MKFNFAKITNSRLMGVIGLIINWSDETDTYFNQYFLLDAEGLGIADYVSIYNPTKKQAYREEERLMGGLGSDRIRISEDEALFLVNHFGGKNIKYNKELPGEVIEYMHIIENYEPKTQLEEVYPKITKKIDNEIEFINYMTMRFIARDRESLMYYSINEEISNMHITEINGTLLKNVVIDKGNHKYISEVIYEDKDGYYTCKIAFYIESQDNKFKIKSLMVTDKKSIYDFQVFDEISKLEYVDVYELNESDEFIEKFYKENPFLQKSFMDEGIIFTRFNFDNNHVKNSTYFINDDIKAVYYQMNDKFFVGTYADKDRKYINKMLQCNFKEYIQYQEGYVFEQNVLYEFAESGSDDFEDFLDE